MKHIFPGCDPPLSVNWEIHYTKWAQINGIIELAKHQTHALILKRS